MKKELFEAITSCTDLQAYVEVSAKMIHCPYWIMDSGFSVIAISHHPDAVEVYNRFVKHTSVMKSIQRWEAYGIFANQNHRTPMVFYDDLLGTKLMILDIFVKKEAIGRMTIILEEELDEALALEVAEGASVYLRTSINDHNRDTYHQAFASLLRGEDLETCAGVLSQMPFGLLPPYQVICIGHVNRDTLFGYAKYINEMDEKLIPVVTGGSLYVLTSKAHSFHRLESQFASGQYSFPFTDLMDTRSYGLQAKFAYEKKKPIADCYLDWISYLLGQETSLQSLLLPEVKACIAYDEEYHTEYFSTLQTYIRCGFSKQAAAKEMNVHLNTVKYRIQQMKALFQIDFERNRVELILSCELLKQQKNTVA